MTERRILVCKPGVLAVWFAAGLTAALLSIQLAVSEEATGLDQDAFVLAYAVPEGLAPGHPPPVPKLGRDVITFQVRPGDTLGNLFATAGVDPDEADRAVRAVRKVFDPRDLRVGQEITIGFLREDAADDRALLRIATIWLEAGSYLELVRLKDGTFVARRTSQASIEDRVFDTSKLIHIVVKPGDTLDALLRSNGVDPAVSDDAVRTLRGLFNPRKLAVGQEIFVSLDSYNPGGLLGLSVKLSESKFATVVRSAEGHFTALRTGRPAVEGVASVGKEPAGGSVAAAASEDARAAPPPDLRGLLSQPAGGPSFWQTVMTQMSAQPAGSGAEASAAGSDEAGGKERTEAIASGDTLMAALLRGGARSDDAQAAVAAFGGVYDPRKIQAGQTVTLSFGAEPGGRPRLDSVSLDLAPERAVVVARTEDGGFRAEDVQKPLEVEPTHATATIASSLYQAAADAGIPVSVLMDLIRLFSYDVDFQRDIQNGDRFEILFDQTYTTSGELVSQGPIRYATLDLSGKKIEVFRFETADGRVDYFDATGQSVRKALLRTPIDGARLTSTYGMREHPILGYSKMHRGVDFAAPKGTPIMAAGDGTIEAIGRNGNYGNYIRIRHSGTYATAYAHLSGFAKGLKKGARVRQGDIIGYVGATGRATGPHLHYEVLVSGDQVNPLSIKLPTGEKLAGAELARFRKESKRILAELHSLPAVTQVAAAALAD